LSFSFGSKYNNIFLQLGILLNNECSVVEDFFQISGMAAGKDFFSEFSVI
jgi:hypothetical protein